MKEKKEKKKREKKFAFAQELSIKKNLLNYLGKRCYNVTG